MFKINSEFLQKLAKDNRAKYKTGNPFPHIVLDNVFPDEVLEQVLDEFPDKNQVDWIKFKDKNQVKLACNNEEEFGKVTRRFIHILNSKPFIEFLEELTGIQELIPDPKLVGGGLHQILKGGLLKVHADFMRHPHTKLERRLNVLVYLNKDWEEDYGGHFELWNKELTECKVKIAPLFNRLAVFTTNATSFHGHPDPLTCPDDMSRKSIAMYYYTNGRPEDDGKSTYDTLFQQRKDRMDDRKKDITKFVKDCIPPFMTRWLLKIARK